MNWSDLSMSQRSELMSIYLKNGITSLEDMKKHYNSFAEGGFTSPSYPPFNNIPQRTDIYDNEKRARGKWHVENAKGNPNSVITGATTANFGRAGEDVYDFFTEDPLVQRVKEGFQFAKGGSIDDPPKGGFIINNYRAKNAQTYKERAAASEKAMIKAWGNMEFIPIRDYDSKLEHAGPMQNSFLLSGTDKDRYMLEHGYKFGEKGDYGLVKKAVGNNDYQVYQTQVDEVDRDYLVPIGNVNNVWYGRENAELKHAGNYPSAIYIDGRVLPDKEYIDGMEEQENFYQKAWDLNDYDNILDRFGYPAVQTTGFSKIEYPQVGKTVAVVDKGSGETHYENKSPMDFLNEYLKKHNLTREVLDDGTIIYALPTVHVKPSTFAKGGKLNTPSYTKFLNTLLDQYTPRK